MATLMRACDADMKTHMALAGLIMKACDLRFFTLPLVPAICARRDGAGHLRLIKDDVASEHGGTPVSHAASRHQAEVDSASDSDVASKTAELPGTRDEWR